MCNKKLLINYFKYNLDVVINSNQAYIFAYIIKIIGKL